MGRCRGDPVVAPPPPATTDGNAEAPSVPEDSATGQSSFTLPGFSSVIEMGVQSEVFTLDDASPSKLFQLAVDPTKYNIVRCLMNGTSGDPDVSVHENNDSGCHLCADARIGVEGNCRASLMDTTTALSVNVQSASSVPAEGASVICDSFTGELRPGTPLNATGEGWFLLDADDREVLSTCVVLGDDEATLEVFLDSKRGSTTCSSPQGICWDMQTFGSTCWMHVVPAVPDAVRISCQPDHDAEHFLAMEQPTLCSISPSEITTFAVEAGPGESAFCRVLEDETSMDWASHTVLDFVLGVNVPPNLTSEINGCDSSNFFGDMEEICFAYGGPSSRSVIYAALGARDQFEHDGELSITCSAPTLACLGHASSMFDVKLGRHNPFVLEVPANVNRIVCNTGSSDPAIAGDIDLCAKVGSNLASCDWDCVSSGLDENEECDVPVAHHGQSAQIFVVICGCDDIEGMVFSCNPCQDSVVSTSRGNPDLP